MVYDGLVIYPASGIGTSYSLTGATIQGLAAPTPMYAFYGTGYSGNLGAQNMNPPSAYGTYPPAGLYLVSGYVTSTKSGPPIYLNVYWTDNRGSYNYLLATSNGCGTAVTIRLNGSSIPYWETTNASGAYDVSVALTQIGS
jgi:hypothetical protein